jgi:hypothetical protein
MSSARDDPNDPHSGATDVTAPATITCVDCGGTCHLLSHPNPDEDSPTGFVAGDIVAYRCEDCLDRWDIELE